MESHIEDVGDILNDTCLLFEVNSSSISAVIDSRTSPQQGTLCLPILALADDFLTGILGLFVESHIADLGDFFDDIPLLFDEDDPSTVVARAQSNPHVHSLHGQSLQVGVIVDTYVQQLLEVSLSIEGTIRSLR